MAVKGKDATAEVIEAARALVRPGPPTQEMAGGSEYCFYCGHSTLIPHLEACLWLRLQKALEELDGHAS